ncbi:MAG: CYTH domain-containing protein [Acidimicrobiales bacterium]
MIEREAKLGVDPSFVMPDLLGAVPGSIVEPAPSQHLDATYYDNGVRRLATLGSTVRYRTGEGADRWTVKLAGRAEGSSLAREEIDVEAPSDPVPPEVRSLVAAHLDSDAELHPVARLVTDRTRLVVLAATAARVAEIDDDLVVVYDGDREVGCFRELEVELAPGGSGDALEAIVARLRESGAGEPDMTPKLVRALRMMSGGSAS